MKVFLSWSGERSLAVAKAFNDWLPDVLQTVKPWLSTESQAKGSTWMNGLRDAIVQSNGMGIFFLTEASQTSPWLFFEAGGVAALEQKRVFTVLVGIDHSEVKQPLNFFHATVLEKDDVWKLVQDINGNLPQPIPEANLKRGFDRAWPDLDRAIQSALLIEDGVEAKRPNPDEALASLVGAVQSIEARLARLEEGLQQITTSDAKMAVNTMNVHQKMQRIADSVNALQNWLRESASALRTRPAEAYASGHSAASFAARGVAPTSGIGDLSIGQVGTLDTAMPIGSPLTLMGHPPTVSVDPGTGNLSLNPGHGKT